MREKCISLVLGALFTVLVTGPAIGSPKTPNSQIQKRTDINRANKKPADPPPQDSGRPPCSVLDSDIGQKYIGECSNGLANGQGEASGRDKYKGTFRNGTPHGQGVYEWGPGSDWAGDVYIGDFANGQRHGIGKYHQKNHDQIFTGTFLNNRGTDGILSLITQGIEKEGLFIDGKLFGFGEIRADKSKNPDRFREVDRSKIRDDGSRLLVRGFFHDDVIVGYCRTPNECNGNLIEARNLLRRTHRMICGSVSLGIRQVQHFKEILPTLGAEAIQSKIAPALLAQGNHNLIGLFPKLPRGDQERYAVEAYELYVTEDIIRRHNIPADHAQAVGKTLADKGDTLSTWKSYCQLINGPT